jgi:hypothetical protein
MLLVSLVSVLSWRFVEQPFRRRAVQARWRFVVGVLTAAALLVSAGILLWASHGLPQRLPMRAIQLQKLATSYRERQLDCYIGPDYTRTGSNPCVIGNAPSPSIAIVGDSHAAALAPGFEPLLHGTGKSALLLARSSCPPLIRFVEYDTVGQRGCAQTRHLIFQLLQRLGSIRTVVLAARWTLYLEHSLANNQQGGVEAGPSPPPVTAADRAAFVAGLRDTVRALLAQGKNVIVVYPVPEAGWDVPLYLAKAQMRGIQNTDLFVSRTWVERRNARARAALDGLGSPPGLYRLFPARSLCGAQACIVAKGGEPYYFDDDHLTPAAAFAVVSQIDPGLVR